MKRQVLKYVCCSVLVLLLAMPALAQNTKGDRPSPAPRDTRFKTPKKTKTESRPAREIRRQDDRPSPRAGAPPARNRRDGERPGSPIRPLFSKSKPQQTQRAWKGDITGRRIKPRGSSSRAWNVYPQPEQINYSSRNLKRTLRSNRNPNVARVQKMQRQSDDKPRVGKPIRPVFHKSRPQKSERAWRGDITGRPIRAQRTARTTRPFTTGSSQMRPGQRAPGRSRGIVSPRTAGRARNIFSGKSFYVNNQSRRPRGGGANIAPMARYPRPQSRTRGGKIIPRSASASFLSRRSTNRWAQFAKPRRRKLAADRDLAGHRLRGKNYETPRPVLINPTWRYQKRVASGERPYEGPAAGGHVSRTRSGRAWKGDVAHRAVRGGHIKKGSDRAFLGFIKGGGFRSATIPGEKRPGRILPGRTPGMGAKGVGSYKGNIRANRRGFGDQGESYTGNIRARRLLKGGGSVSGRVWNNQGMPIQGKTPGKGSRGIGYSGNVRLNGRRGFSDQGEEYTGNIRARRPDKGGGSRSGKLWNNNNTPVLVRTPKGESARIAGYQGNMKGRRGFQDQGEEYTGNIKAQRPDKGGGSVSGKLWNNNQRPIAGKDYSQARDVGRYSGNIKARRPEEGGGSVSGKLWNNKERPIPGKDYSYAKNVTRYSGNMKAKRPEKGGGSVSGVLWNNREKPIAVRTPKNMEGGNFAGDSRIPRGRFARNPNSADGALPVAKASASFMKAGRSSRGVRRSWDYIKNPSSDDEAQRTREPGRAFARSTDFHGNIKIKRFDLFKKDDLHPDAQFVKQNKNNVPEEKDMLTNFKLWWARLFRKSETQPDHLKDKEGKPRYDKGEAGLWYE